ncbi:MAG: tetratricopeptide repeat protein [Alphaproteobacteria bacterium]
MSDIFQEVDEEVRREKLQQLWERHSNLIVSLALLVVLAVAGWRGYEWWESKKAAESGAQFEAAILLAEGGKQAEAQAAFAKIAQDGSSGYRILARFREAAELAKTDPAAAVTQYASLAADSSLDRALRDLATIRGGIILVDTAPLAELAAKLEPLTTADRPFRHTARELLALSAWRNGDTAVAKRWLDLIATDTETPAGTRARMDVLMTLSNDKAKT